VTSRREASHQKIQGEIDRELITTGT
jgi:hypothetical protein